MQILEKIFQIVSSYAIPNACLICETYQLHSLCSDCLTSLTRNALINYECCSQCGLALEIHQVQKQKCNSCTANPPYFDRTFCLDRYEGSLQYALHQLKYQKRISYAHGLAYAWNQIHAKQLQKYKGDFLFPVPLSNHKLAIRGFNQSWEIARRIQCRQDIVKNPFILQRHHHDSTQVGRNAVSRIERIRNKFYVDGRHEGALMGKTIIIFDDVMTTGSTLNEIARILKENGASQVINWVLLRTTRVLHV